MSSHLKKILRFLFTNYKKSSCAFPSSCYNFWLCSHFFFYLFRSIIISKCVSERKLLCVCVCLKSCPPLVHHCCVKLENGFPKSQRLLAYLLYTNYNFLTCSFIYFTLGQVLLAIRFNFLPKAVICLFPEVFIEQKNLTNSVALLYFNESDGQ